VYVLLQFSVSPQVFSGVEWVVRVARSLVFCVVFCRSLFVLLSLFFCPLCYISFLISTSDYPFGIFKLFLTMFKFRAIFFLDFMVIKSPKQRLETYYPLANEVAKGYSNATVRPSFRNILVNTLESTSFNGFWQNLVHT
jgi:hypothetical protein